MSHAGKTSTQLSYTVQAWEIIRSLPHSFQCECYLEFHAELQECKASVQFQHRAHCCSEVMLRPTDRQKDGGACQQSQENAQPRNQRQELSLKVHKNSLMLQTKCQINSIAQTSHKKPFLMPAWMYVKSGVPFHETKRKQNLLHKKNNLKKQKSLKVKTDSGEERSLNRCGTWS